MKKREVLILFSTEMRSKRIKLPNSLITYQEIDNYIFSKYKNTNYTGWGEANFHLPEWIKMNNQYIAEIRR